MGHLIVPFGDLRDIRLKPGETIIVSPLAGGYSGGGVLVAIAMGARGIAMGCNEAKHAMLKNYVLAGKPNDQIEIVKITGDEAMDLQALQSFVTIDAVLDLTPPHASKSLRLRDAASALYRGGRVSVVGFVEQPVVS